MKASYDARALAEIHFRQKHFKRVYRDDPVAFVMDCITFSSSSGPTDYQKEIMSSLVQYGRVAVRGPHGLGKTAMASWMLLWYALTRDGEDWKAPTTASAWRQLTKFLWPEVHKWVRHLNWERLVRDPFNVKVELQTLSLKLTTGEAFAVASDKPDYIEGAHSDHLLYVFDEAKAIPDATFDAAEGAFAGAGETFALAISTPGPPAGRFYDIHKRKPGYEDWWVRHVTIDEVIAAGRVTEKWVEQRRLQWTEQSSVFKNRVLGEFAASDEEGVIPLAWIEAAIERWHRWNDAGGGGIITRLGVDVARTGADKTIVAFRSGDIITELVTTSQASTMETAGQVAGYLRAHPSADAIIDVIGIGAGVVDRLEEDFTDRVLAFNAAMRTDAEDLTGTWRFRNVRSYAWWHLRELLDPANGYGIALPPDDGLIGDLTAPRYKIMSGGVIAIESKVEIKKRLGRSPDAGDAIIMAFSDEFENQGIEVLF